MYYTTHVPTFRSGTSPTKLHIVMHSEAVLVLPSRHISKRAAGVCCVPTSTHLPGNVKAGWANVGRIKIETSQIK